VISTYVCKSDCSKICCIKMFFWESDLNTFSKIFPTQNSAICVPIGTPPQTGAPKILYEIFS
jgi:hypothetical protein